MSAAIYSILTNNVAVNAVVGLRVYPLIDNQSYEVPFITYQKTNTLAHPTKTGVSGLDEQRYQINIVAATPFASQQLADLVREALDYNSGTFSGVVLQQSYFENEHNLWHEYVTNNGACMIAQDYTLIIQR